MSFKDIVIKAVKNPKKILIHIWVASSRFIKSDRLYLKVYFKLLMNETLDLKNPKTFNQKIQWLKLYNKSSLCTKMVDKYEVREIIKNEIGEEYLIPIIGVWDNFDDINFDIFPNKFVLKATHDSGSVIICHDKSKFDYLYAKRKLNKAIKINYFYPGREYPYRNVKPRIIAEQLLERKDLKELMDYKFLCFNGKVKCSFICLNRNSINGLNVDFYDLNWNLLPFERKYKQSGIKISPPINYYQMIDLSEKLSSKFPFLRIDFYEIDGQIYFGEFTFHPGGGVEKFYPKKWDNILGEMIELPI
ncbi:hypothetical protein SDC9_23313 [bioreactor metagenome]|uniref:Glycosyl transferase n=1 Tax=bioreactor metagenome TaxID=1076179 RepID=A0A644UET4_9ZZZZ